MAGIKEINSTQLADWIDQNQESFLLVDVRSVAETARGILPGAETVPMHLVPYKLDEWRDAEKIVFYCHSGARSGQVCAFLQQQGVDVGINLSGGILDWHRQGYPIELPGHRRLVV